MRKPGLDPGNEYVLGDPAFTSRRNKNRRRTTPSGKPVRVSACRSALLKKGKCDEKKSHQENHFAKQARETAG